MSRWTETLRQTLGLAPLALLWATGAATAQPSSLDPSPIPTAPTDKPPAAAPAPAPPPVDAAPRATVPGPVQVQSLAALDLFSTGRETGLGMDLWSGSSADTARAVIPTLASKPLSPAFEALALRVLATAATAPQGAGDDLDLAAARAKALLALGDARAVDSIVERTNGVANNATLSYAGAEAALILGRDEKACAIGEALALDRDTAYWLHLRAYCQAIAGKPDAAQLTATLADQRSKDPVFARLIGVIIAGSGDPGAPSLRTGLDYAMTRRLKIDPTAALPSASRAVARQIEALQAGAPPLQGLPATEADVLAQLKTARSERGYLDAAKAQKAAIAGLVASGAPLTAPVQLATAALAAGDVMSARTIRATLTGDGAASPVDLAILDAGIAVASGRPDAQTLDRLAERGAVADPKTRARPQGATAIFAATQGPMNAQARGEFVRFDLGRSDPAAKLMALDMAADAGAKGETALIALWIAEGGGAAGPDPADRARIVKALAKAGFADEARAVALEGLISLQSR
jgi:hypothetical protein